MLIGLVRILGLAVVLASVVGCSRPHTTAYREMYAHLENPKPRFRPSMREKPYFLVILVDARHLDYTDCHSFITTVAKHPSDMSKTGDVGHAWIYLQGMNNGVPVYIEGGFSGERGIVQPQYFDGIMNYIDYGCVDPWRERPEAYVYEPNPVKYLWETQYDGFFQWGSGIHTPSYAAKIDLTEEQFWTIVRFVESYDYVHYSLVGNQCSSYITQIGALIGLDLEATVGLPIDSMIDFGGEKLQLWKDPQYSVLPISTPDFLEKRLMELVAEGRAEYALDWYERFHGRPLGKGLASFGENLLKFPRRCSKFLYMKNCM